MNSPHRFALPARPNCLVTLPGTGFDAEFSRRAYGPLARYWGARLVTPDPQPGRLVASYWEDIEQVCEEATVRGETVAIAGVSLGAIVALRYAASCSTTTLRQGGALTVSPQSPLVAVMAAMVPWVGDGYTTAPAALAAAATAERIRHDGVSAVREAMVTSSPTWLADLQTPCWDHYGEDLAALMEEVATTAAPTTQELSQCELPVGLLAVDDDPLHPATVTAQWAAALPWCATAHCVLSDIAEDVAVFSHAAASLWEDLRS